MSGFRDRAATAPLEPGTPGEMQPPAYPVHLADSTRRVQWTKALPGIALAGFCLLFGLMIPLAPFLRMIVASGIAGAVAAGLYARRVHRSITPSQAARVGAAGGLTGFAVLMGMIAVQMAASAESLAAELRQALSEYVAKNPDPAAQQVFDALTSPGGLVALLVAGSAVFLIVVLICSALGGALAARFSDHKPKNV